MPTLNVALGERSYPIHLIREAPAELAADEALRVRGRAEGVAMVVTDSNVGPLYAADLIAALRARGLRTILVTLEAGEATKSLETIAHVTDRALLGGLTRRDLLIALGGGVVGDITGFAAAILHRGVDFIQVPTTLLAQVDSSVGGKTGVNHSTGKNLLGAFWQPRSVVASHHVLLTLPERERRCGLAEALKHGFIADADLVAWAVAHADALRAFAPEPTLALVEACCRIKAAVVEADEREAGQRAILNFGHTLGHAYERLLGYGTLTHGEAVALGMVWAARISERLGVAEPGLESSVTDALKAVELPCDIDSADLPGPERLINAALTDKKADGSHVRFVTLTKVGRPLIRNLAWDHLREALSQRPDRP